MPFISAPAKILEIIDFAPGEIRAIRLKLPDDVEVKARPGNAFWLKLLGKASGELEMRAYSFSSVPRAPVIETVVNKAVENPNTSWTFQEFTVGLELEARIEIKNGAKNLFINPRKDLELEPDNWWHGKKFLFYGLGTGVTPHLSAVRYIAERGMDADIIYVSSSKTRSRLIFHEELFMLEKRFPTNFRYLPFLTRENPENWMHFTGRPTIAPFQSQDGFFKNPGLKNLIPDLAERHIRICGAKGTKKNFESDAVKLGISFPGIRTEEW